MEGSDGGPGNGLNTEGLGRGAFEKKERKVFTLEKFITRVRVGFCLLLWPYLPQFCEILVSQHYPRTHHHDANASILANSTNYTLAFRLDIN